MEQARMDQLNIVKMSHGTNQLSRTGSHSESISMIKSSKDKPSTQAYPISSASGSKQKESSTLSSLKPMNVASIRSSNIRQDGPSSA